MCIPAKQSCISVTFSWLLPLRQTAAEETHGMQDLNIDDLEAPAPVHVRVVGLRCEAQACTSAASGLVPLELIAAAGKRAGQRRATTCEKRAQALSTGFDKDNPAMQPLGSAQFQTQILALGRFRVRLDIPFLSPKAHVR